MDESRTQSKAARLRRIEHKLYNTPQGMGAVELANYCGVDRRTIYRDIESLDSMGVPVWQLDGKFGIEREGYQSTVRLNLNETVALYFGCWRITPTRTTRTWSGRWTRSRRRCPTRRCRSTCRARPT
jgi:predicted DNA-binding transcriptional regulator YafY